MDFVESIDNVYNSSIKAIQDASGKLLLSHLGEMKPDTITNLSEKAESKLFEINAAKKNIKNVITIIIPRHINRVPKIITMCKDHNLKIQILFKTRS